jgi:predicted small integral membrane protein
MAPSSPCGLPSGEIALAFHETEKGAHMIRYLKIILVVFVGLQGLAYFIANSVNFEYALLAVGEVLSQRDSPAYQNLILPPVTNPALIKVALIIIMTGELLVGVLSFIGAFNMLGAAGKPAAAFEASKKFAILGAGMALIVWFGGFTVIGAALFQMWQGQVGVSSFEGAHMYLVPSGIVLLFVAMKDD